MKRTPKNPIPFRASVVGVFFSLWLAGIAGKAVYLQTFQGDFLSKKASDQYEASVRDDGKRGAIYDRNRMEMAVSIDTTSIGAYPGKIKDAAKMSAVLSKTLQIDRANLTKRLAPGKTFVWVERQVTPRETEAVSALGLGGIDFRTEHKRFYPSRTLAAQVLGFVNIDGNGVEGIEYHYNSELKGDKGRRTVFRDALGRGIASQEENAASVNGEDLILTLDRTIQFMAEQALKEAVDTFGAKSAMAVVMDPKTGAVLAMAHYPFFNPNTYGEFTKWQWRNRAITDRFEPGSTLKVFTAAAGVEHKNLTPASQFFCENGVYRVGGHTIHDTHEYGWLSLEQIVKFSSNIGATKVLEKMGGESLYTTLKAFGFGDKTGIDCPGETAGSLAPYKQWQAIDACNIAFGQGMSVSALQLTAAISAIANDGVLMKPYVVQAVTDSAGKELTRFEPQVVRRAVSAATARTIKTMMMSVTSEGGTAERIALDDYPIAGKTGTAQKVGETGGYAAGKYVSSFVGFVPADDPKATILVVVDEPEKSHYGGVVAGPAFRKIAEECLNYMNVSPTRPNTRLTVARGEGVG